MKTKTKGWKEGVLAVELRSVGGTTHKKGDTVRYKRIKSQPDRDGNRFTDYEYHVLNTDNFGLIRTYELNIEGIPVMKEPWNTGKDGIK